MEGVEVLIPIFFAMLVTFPPLGAEDGLTVMDGGVVAVVFTLLAEVGAIVAAVTEGFTCIFKTGFSLVKSFFFQHQLLLS